MKPPYPNLFAIIESLKTLKDKLKDVLEVLPLIIIFVPISIVLSPLGVIYALVVKYANYNLVKKHKNFIDKLELDYFVYKNMCIDECTINNINKTDYPIKLRFSNVDAVFNQVSQINAPLIHHGKYNQYLSFLVESNLTSPKVVQQLNLINKDFLNKTFLTNFTFFYLKFDKTKAKSLLIEVASYKIIFILPFYHVVYLGAAIQVCYRNIKEKYQDYRWKKRFKKTKG